MSQHPTTLTDPKAICAHSLEIMADGDLADFEALAHPEAIDREESGPPATRGTGPAAFHAIALWLRGAFSDLCWDVHHMAADSEPRRHPQHLVRPSRQAVRDLRRRRGGGPGDAADRQDLRRHPIPLVPPR